MVVLNNTTVLSSRDLFWYVFCPVSSSYGLICLYGSFLASPCSRGWLLRRDLLRCLVERNSGDMVMVFTMMKRWCYMVFGWFCGGEGVVVAVVFRWFCEGDMVVKGGCFVLVLWW